MSILRVALFTTAVVLVLPPSQAKADESVEVQFLGGTDKTIPADTFGTLSLKDPNELRFQYGTSVYRLPYTQIMETDVVDHENKGHWLVHMPGKKHFETLAISSKDPNGAENSLNFQVDSRLASAVESSIILRKKRAVAATEDPDSYWGDKIWKTRRTLPLWEQQKPAPTTVAVGAGGTK